MNNGDNNSFIEPNMASFIYCKDKLKAYAVLLPVFSWERSHYNNNNENMHSTAIYCSHAVILLEVIILYLFSWNQTTNIPTNKLCSAYTNCTNYDSCIIIWLQIIFLCGQYSVSAKLQMKVTEYYDLRSLYKAIILKVFGTCKNFDYDFIYCRV